jgi:abelson tyrosine-protein kinase 1
VYRLSHQPQPRKRPFDLASVLYLIFILLFPDGALRWQAPEIISGESVMSPEVDVYAFAIVCIEILSNGELPWPMLDDQAVQQLVLRMYPWELDVTSD